MSQPYFCEGSEAMVLLEGMVDKVGIANVLYALEHICGAKASHIAENWQDASTAQWWEQRANRLGKVAALPFFHDA